MHAGRVVFSQLMDFFPMYEFQKLVRHYRGNYKVRSRSAAKGYGGEGERGGGGLPRRGKARARGVTGWGARGAGRSQEA